MNSKIRFYLLALVVLVVNVVVAQERKQPSDITEFRREVKTYQQQHIAPFLKEQRLELDKKLSEAEKAELADIREQMTRHRQEQMQLFRQMRTAQNEDNSLPSQELKAAYKEAQSNYRNQLYRLAELAKRNQKHLTAIGAIVKTRQEQWKTDLLALADKHGLLEQPEKDEPTRSSFVREKYYQHWNTIRFLLMDPEQPAPHFLEDEPQRQAALLSPNPASSTATLQYTVSTSGNVRIELLDQSGKMLQQVENKKVPAGKHEQSVDLSQLKSGVYFYRITSETGSETVRFIKR